MQRPIVGRKKLSPDQPELIGQWRSAGRSSRIDLRERTIANVVFSTDSSGRIHNL